MSNDISYLLKVVDDFSGNLKKFQRGIQDVDKQALQHTQNINQAAKSTKFFTQNLVDMGKAAGLYFGIAEVKNFAKGIFDTRVQMDGLEASLSAILPKFDHTKSGTQLATDEINYLREATNKLGVSFKDVLPAYTQLISNSPFKLDETRSLFEAFAGYGRLNALTGEQQKSMMYAIQQMMGKGKIQSQEYNLQLSPVMPNSRAIFLKALQQATGNAKLTQGDLMKYMENGQLGAGLLKYVGKVINEDYGKAIEHKAHTLGAEVYRVSNQFQQFQTTLSVMFEPTMRSATLAMNGMWQGLNNVFGAVQDTSKIDQLSGAARLMATAFQSAGAMVDLAVGALKKLDEMTNIGGKLETVFKFLNLGVLGIEKFGEVSAITANSVMSGDGENGSKALRMSWDDFYNQSKNILNPQTQKSEVVVTFDNMPKGATAQVKSASTSHTTKLRTGNTVSNSSGGAGTD